MKKIVVRWSIIIGVFIISVIGFGIYFNQGTTDMTVEMSEATLPIIYIQENSMRINEMHGYVNQMKTGTMRDSITTIGSDRSCNIIIEKYNASIDSIGYEVRSIDGDRLIEDTPLAEYRDLNKEITATITLKDLIEENVEYSLAIRLKLNDGRFVYYYTTVIQNDSAGLKDKLDYVEDFNSKTFSKEKIKELSTYLEPRSDSDNTTFGSVGINNSLNQVSWGEMNPEIIGEKRYTIREISAGMATIQLDYQVRTGKNSDKRYYNVHEVYKIRRTTQRFYLLDFDRTMDQIFVMDKGSCTNDKILLGILNEKADLTESDGGEVLAFTNGGRLYTYNVSENKMARLFAFYDSAGDDYRNQFLGSAIKIMDVEENGNVSFVVYGYMNRGNHEGRVGIEVCYYDSLVNTVEEQVFIPYDGSYSLLCHDMEKLSYLNKSGDLFLFLNGELIKIDTQNVRQEVIAKDFDEDSLHVSVSHKSIVWKDSVSGVEKVYVMNLASELISTISSGGDYIVPIGFMNEDLIYGQCKHSDIYNNTLGDFTYLMNSVIIRSERGTILKEYNLDNIYVTDGYIEENQITLKRVEKNTENGSIKVIDDDYITNNTEMAAGKNKIVRAATEPYEYIYQIQVKSAMDSKTLKFLTPKQVLYEGGRTIILDNGDRVRYLVYGNKGIEAVYSDAGKAVREAFENRGTVTDTMGQVIYNRGELLPRNQIMAIGEQKVAEGESSLSVCIDTMLKLNGVSTNTADRVAFGNKVGKILQDNMNDAYILNLTGCTMDSTLYYVNQDIPVLAVLNSGEAVLIVGFNEQNVVLMNPVLGTIYKSGINDSRTMFAENGNRFMTYMKKSEE